MAERDGVSVKVTNDQHGARRLKSHVVHYSLQDAICAVRIEPAGCPVRPEALMHGFLTLQKKIREKEPGMFLRR